MARRLALHRFVPDDRAPGGARRFARETLDSWTLGSLAETVELLVSEVVTNTVGHARTGGEMVMLLTRSGVRVEVSDHGRGSISRRQAGPEDVGGRGMAIIDALASRWGVDDDDRDGAGHTVKTVWFEVDLAGADASV